MFDYSDYKPRRFVTFYISALEILLLTYLQPVPTEFFFEFSFQVKMQGVCYAFCCKKTIAYLWP